MVDLLHHGLVFIPTGQHGWMNSHAQVPTGLLLNDQGEIRIYFSTRPRPGLSLTTFVDLQISSKITEHFLNPQPILDLGERDSFDEHGIMPSSIIRDGDNVLLYYSGWSRRTNVPYANYTGLAISSDCGKTFKKYSKEAILDENTWGPYSATSPCVIRVGQEWHMYYCSGTDWITIDDKLEHTYDIKHAVSYDGIKWEKTEGVVISQSNREEALTRPSVYFDGSCYHMFFCFRQSKNFRDGSGSYQVGYAYSADALSWNRTDYIVPSSPEKGSWDSRMMAYPNLLRCDSKYLLLYNGDSFGAHGFGAVSSSVLPFP